MRAVVQRVLHAEVTVDGEVIGAIQRGLLVLVAVEAGDSEGDVAYMSRKLMGLRIFDDSEGKMNLSLKDKKYSLLCVSNLFEEIFMQQRLSKSLD